MKTLTVVLGLVTAACAGSCATVPSAASANACGDRCAAIGCPTGFVCTVDSRCAARCVPEPIPPR